MKQLILTFRFPIVVLTQLTLITLAYFLAFASRFELTFVYEQPQYLALFLTTLPVLILIRMFSYWHFNLFKGLWRYVSMKDLIGIVYASLAGTVCFVAYIFIVAHEYKFPRSILLMDFAYNILCFGGIRMLVRVYREGISSKSDEAEGVSAKKVLIIGAGDAGEMILREMMKNPRLGYKATGFVDDDRRKRKTAIHGVPVLGNTNDIPRLILNHQIEEVILAIPSAAGIDVSRIINICKQADSNVKTLPFVGDLIEGTATLSQIRDVNIEDLLGRKVVNLDMGLIGKELYDKVILVTGAAGSIGSELVRQIARFSPKKIILFERGENDLFHFENQLSKGSWNTTFVPYIGDVKDRERLISCFEKHAPSYVFHAAAYKHVPLMEINPSEAVKNNILGTMLTANIAEEYGVEKFVLISTDKAVRPANVMGATKRVAEMVIQSMDSSKTHFVAVRFGNVLGSNGSVIPLFREQIADGGPITITHPEITRYFMTIPEAVQLVIQAGAMGKGGEVFLLEMGEPVRIKALAENLIRLSGKEPGEDIELVYTGLRPGEKLYEELLTVGEGIVKTHHEKIMVLTGDKIIRKLLIETISELEAAAKSGNVEEVKTLLKLMVPDYHEMTAKDYIVISNDPFSLGNLLLDGGYIMLTQLREALDEQLENRGLLGEILIKDNVITKDILEILLIAQKNIRTFIKKGHLESVLKIGEIVTKLDLASPRMVEKALEVQRENGKLLGTILVEEGAITGNMLALTLKIQNNVLLIRAKGLPDNIVNDKLPRKTDSSMVH